MRKILFLFVFAFVSLTSVAQIVCDGTYVVTEPKEGLNTKE